MSEVKVDTISERTAAGGVTIDGVLIKDNVLKIPGGSPGADKVLTSDASGNATWEDAAAGGITDCSMWRLTTTFTGDATPIASNLEEDDGPDYVRLGSAMTESSGVFTFPSTGFWRVDFAALGQNNAANEYMDIAIESVISTVYDMRAKASMGWSSFAYAGCYCSTLFDCSNTSTHKVAFTVSQTSASNGVVGDTNNNNTYMIFTRLADT